MVNTNNIQDNGIYKATDLNSFLPKKDSSRQSLKIERSNEILTYGKISKVKIIINTFKSFFHKKDHSTKYDYIEVLE
jgi:hypothetical protein